MWWGARSDHRKRSVKQVADRSTSTGGCRTSGWPGEGSKSRPVPVHPAALSALNEYLKLTPQGPDRKAPLLPAIQSRWADRSSTGDGIYKLVKKYASLADGAVERIVHAPRATAATNALEHETDIARVRDWLGHANISSTRLYDGREHQPEDSPTFCVNY